MKITPDWPVGVNSSLICDKSSEEDKMMRANSILEMLVHRDLNGKKFLDFGCGEGHVRKAAEEKGAIAVGYDLSGTITWDEVKQKGPYDVILLYDVLDHSDDPVAVLKQIKHIMLPRTMTIVRFHPWIGRHGGHMYEHAYIHLFANVESENTPKQKVITPLATYRSWVREAGLTVVKENTISEKPEPFFLEDDKIEELNKLLNGKEPPPGWPRFQMSNSFVDFYISI
jgi:SAM-dependent methyltransferase